ncbi:oxygenase MpaB family protein [Taibaiella koreensis]|uniref:oxygenase MpaB family protein n=1 Tax=Taibaiella koreensis TaxID=1268548 RepID=UPI000E59EB2C|nr:oxygenase MpaB family protein [Taibaiella koreensis]
MKYFVPPGSIVRTIWGQSDTVLFIFAGAAAEFALNKAVDWLYFTGKLPADPIGRLFSTVTYARQIIFATEDEAYAAIARIRQIHTGVEQSRGSAIPDWAYRDVLFMLIHYSLAAFELLERPATPAEKETLAAVFLQVGERMGITGLPKDEASWRQAYQEHLSANLQYSKYTTDLYRQYRKHLGPLRYHFLLQVQLRLVSPIPLRLLPLKPSAFTGLLLDLYRKVHILRFLRAVLIPAQYKAQVRQLDVKA